MPTFRVGSAPSTAPTCVAASSTPSVANQRRSTNWSDSYSRRKERDEELNRAAQYRFHWWMHVELSLREVQNRLRGPSPIIQLSDWDQINSSIRERDRSIVLIDTRSL